ncbi:MAG TPA: APC family permease [Blastocatellia bacterium]|nr:APC family permease [Blastocatellia bacterium]
MNKAMEGRGSSQVASSRLVRAVGLFGLTSISLNGVIGSGIFVLPATVAALLGPASPTAYLIAALVTALIVVCFAEAGSMFERTGGPYLYAREAFGDFVGFQIGWMFLLTRLAAGAAISNAFTAYLGYYWPALASGSGRITAITLLFLFLAWLNIIGIRYGARVVNLLTIAKLLPLLLFISVGLFFVDHGRYSLIALPDTEGLRQASLALIFAFGGFENASVPSEEVKNPTKNLPVALMTSIIVTTIIYLLIQIVALGTLPSLAADPTPLASAGQVFLGPVGAGIITMGAILSTAGSNSALVLVGPRILYAFGESGQLPSALARVHERYRTPYLSVIVFAFITWAIALYGNFAQLVAVSAIARLLFSISTCLAVPVLRRETAKTDGRFTIPGGATIPALAALISLWLLTGITRTQAIMGLLALVFGVVFYFFYTRLARTRATRK